jgi:hypothetical protein
MKARLILRNGVVLVSVLIAASSAWAQSPDITSFNGNGVLTWTNSNTNLFYTVQWAASLLGTGIWQSSYATMQDIQSTTVSVSVKVPMFYRVQGSSNRVVYPAPVARTGQTPTVPLVAPEGSDGVLQKGVALPTPRFVDNANGTVTDQKTGLIWLKNANAFGGRSWEQALTDCNTLTNGMYGLTDGSVAGDWRLPNIEELRSLTAFQYSNPALTDTPGTGQWTEGQPFTSVQSGLYWSSTTEAGRSDYAWYVLLSGGQMYPDHKSHTYYVWPVRDGL